MASIKKEFETDHYAFGIASVDQPIPKRNVQRELKNELLDPEKEITAFEQAKGIIRKPKVNMGDYDFNNIIITPDKDKDRDLLNKLLNDPQYLISYYKDNWTPQGNYCIFIIYGKKKQNEQQR
jgi:hypothetical protein